MEHALTKAISIRPKRAENFPMITRTCVVCVSLDRYPRDKLFLQDDGVGSSDSSHVDLLSTNNKRILRCIIQRKAYPEDNERYLRSHRSNEIGGSLCEE